MLSTLRNAWKVPDLRKKLIYTVLMLLLFRFGNFIPVPGVDAAKLKELTTSSGSGSYLSFYDLISGGALSQCSIFAMGVLPYINASIIMQLLTVAIPKLEQLQKEGEDGRKKIQNYTRYSSIVLSVLQSYATYALMTKYGAVTASGGFEVFILMLTLITASSFLMWLGDQITVKGVGNGVSLIIFWGIISRFPKTVINLARLQSTNTISSIQVFLLIAVSFIMIVAVVISSLCERRIPVQYAGKTVGGKMFKGQSSHIPINLNSSVIIAIIFAMSVLQFPTIITQFVPNSKFTSFINNKSYSIFVWGTWKYAIAYAFLIVFFTWFYTQITFKPDEMAENMHKSSGFIPGIRPGASTEKYIEKVLDRVSILGGLFAVIIAVTPIIVESSSSFQGISFGGTSLLIEVGVALEFVKQIESQLVMRHYEGFLK